MEKHHLPPDFCWRRYKEKYDGDPIPAPRPDPDLDPLERNEHDPDN